MTNYAKQQQAKAALSAAILATIVAEGWTIGGEFAVVAQKRYDAAFAAWQNGDCRADVNEWLGHCTPDFIVDNA